MYDALVLDVNALHYLQYIDTLQEEWLERFEISPNTKNLSLKIVDNIAYVLSDRAKEHSQLLVIYINNRELFPELPKEHRLEALLRAFRAGLSLFEPTVEIPVSWKSYNRGSLLSFQSNSLSTQVKARMLMDRRPRNLIHGYVYAIDIEERDLRSIKPDYVLFDRAIAGHKVAYKKKSVDSVQQTGSCGFKLELHDQIIRELTAGSNLKQWYNSKLTAKQREFVDMPLDKSVRLIGSAGTGKTLAMVIKCLLTMYKKYDERKNFRIAFLTHSMSTVEIVRGMLIDLDYRGFMYSLPDNIFLLITTLQELANSAMNYSSSGLQPLSIDGLDGRKMQMELLGSIIEEFKNSDWMIYRSECSETFQRYIETEKNDPAANFFCWEVMNEFACVLDAEGIRKSERHRKKYLDEQRKKWMMHLETRTEREVIIELYSRFRNQLKEIGAIGIDQMISDYLSRYLCGFGWEALRSKEGFDIIFVDELHLFNRQERMIFQYLTRSDNDNPIVFMAYDSKQSPRDTFIGLDAKEIDKYNFWAESGLGDVEKIELQDVFRYTPEIAQALAYLDQTYPACDLDDEWPVYSGVSHLDNGPKPICVEFRNTLELYNKVFPRAQSLASRLNKGRKVAVLCLSNEQFQQYLNAGNHKEKFLAITSREELPNIRYAGKHFIFSRPEYVAGLQFEVVLLIDVNQGEIPLSEEGIGARRRFVSEVYLGASRAEKQLEIYGNKERGGISDVLRFAINSKTIQKLSWSELADRL